MARFFNLREAQELLPRVRAWLDEVSEAKASMEDIDGELALAAHITMSGGVEIDPVAVVRKKIARQEAVSEPNRRCGRSSRPAACSRISKRG